MHETPHVHDIPDPHPGGRNAHGHSRTTVWGRKIGALGTRFERLILLTHRPRSQELIVLVLLLLSGATFLSGYVWRWVTIKDRFDSIFEPAIGLTASPWHADRDISLHRLALRVEKELRVLSRDVAADNLGHSPQSRFATRLESLTAAEREALPRRWCSDEGQQTHPEDARPARPPGVTGDHRAPSSRYKDLDGQFPAEGRCPSLEDYCPARLYSNQVVDLAYTCYRATEPDGAERPTKDCQKPQPQPESPQLTQEELYSWMLVTCSARFRIHGEPLGDLKGAVGSAEKKFEGRLQRVADSLKFAFPHFPYDARILSKRTTVPDPWDFAGYRPDGPLVAFVYTALAIPPKVHIGGRDPKPIKDAIQRYLKKRARLDPGEHVITPGLRGEDLPGWANRSYVYLEYPTGELPEEFTVVERPWFYLGMAGSPGVQWSRGYGDPGVGMPVVTASTAVLDDQEQPIGVIAVDLRITELNRYGAESSAVLANLAFTFLASLVMFSMLYASNMWKYFQYVCYFLLAVYAYYLVQATAWLILPQPELVRLILHHLATLVSIVNSMLLLIAVTSLDQVERRTSFIGSILPRVEGFLGRFPGSSHFFVITAASLAVWFVTLLLEHTFVTTGAESGSTDIGMWIDAVLSFTALLFFGLRFSSWCYSFMRSGRIVGSLSGVVFISYAALQLIRPLRPEDQFLYWVLFWGKIALLTLVILGVFLYTQNYNYIRRQLAQIARKLFARPLAKHVYVIVGKRTLKGVLVLAANDALCEGLGYRDDALGRAVWRRKSILGSEGFYEPSRAIDIEELFVAGEWQRLEALLRSTPPDEHARTTTKDGSAIKRLSAQWAVMKDWYGVERPVCLHTVSTALLFSPPVAR